MSTFKITGTFTDADGSTVDFTAIDTADYNKVIAMSGMGSVGALSTATVQTVLPTAPVVTGARTVSSQNTAFNVNAGVGLTTTSNNLKFFGTSIYGSGNLISVYLNGVLQGTATTGAAGVWSFLLGPQGDASYTMTATILIGSVTSLVSSAFNFTIAALFTNLPVSIGSNLAFPNTLNIGPDVFEIQNDGANPNSCIVVDTHTFHLTLLKTDNWSTFNRDELSSHTTFTDGQTLNATYEFMIDSNFPVFTDNDQPMCTQIHENNNTSTQPVMYGMSFYPSRGTSPTFNSPTWQYDNGASSYIFVDGTSVGLNSLTAGVWHTADIIVHPNSPSNGTVQCWIDGVLYLNGANMKPSGAGPNPPYYFKFGLYRGSVGTQTTTNGMYYRNILVKYS